MDYKKLERELKAIIGYGYNQVPGLGAVLYKDGNPCYKLCAGRAYIGKSGYGLDKDFRMDSLFRVASVSKQFTVYAIMQLVEKSLLGLDADVSQYLGFSLRHPYFPEVPITVRMLCSHTSGLRDGVIYCIPPGDSVQEFFVPEGRFFEGGAHFSSIKEPPGDYFSYCNLNYGLLGTIIEAVTGQRFDHYMELNVLAPLDIDGSYLPSRLSHEAFCRLGGIYQKIDDSHEWQPMMDQFDGVQPGADTVTMQNPYAENDDPASYSICGYKPGTNATFFSPQGGLRISLTGLGHVLELLMNGGVYRDRQIISASSLESMLSKHWSYEAGRKNGDTCDGTLLSYGLGLYQIAGNTSARVCENYEVDLVGHTGQAFGLLSGVFFRPGTRDGFAYIMNGEGSSEKKASSHGRFSGNFVWEERIMNALCCAMLE